MQLAWRWHLLLATLALLCGHGTSFPALYEARYANSCSDHPTTHFGKVHDYTSAPDKTVAFILRSASSGKAVTPVNGASRVCAGDKYNLLVQFGAPALRNYLLTSTHGSLDTDVNDCDAFCPARICSPAPTSQGKAVFSLPCNTVPGTEVTIKVTSANGRTPTPGSTLRSAKMSVVVDGACPGKCPGTSAEKAPPKKTQSAAAAAAGKSKAGA